MVVKSSKVVAQTLFFVTHGSSGCPKALIRKSIDLFMAEFVVVTTN